MASTDFHVGDLEGQIDTLSDQIGTLNGKITNSSTTGISFTPSANISSVTTTIVRKGDICSVKIIFTFSGSTNSEINIGTLSGTSGAVNTAVIDRTNSKFAGAMQCNPSSGSGTMYINMSSTGNMSLAFTTLVYDN